VIVSVGRGVDVTVRVGGGVNISVEGRLVDVFAAMGEEEAVGLPSVELQALVRRISTMSTNELLAFIF
jgi:hypothetical protein